MTKGVNECVRGRRHEGEVDARELPRKEGCFLFLFSWTTSAKYVLRTLGHENIGA